MKKILTLLSIIILLSSCWMTQEEKLKAIKDCEELWLWYQLNYFQNNVFCENPKSDVMSCIQEYTRWIDEKYNNPDTVSNLREENYSKVVETCNNIFWKNENVNPNIKTK